MIASVLIGSMLAGAAPQQQSVALPANVPLASLEARDDPWFIDNTPVILGKRRYVKYGLPRVLAPFEIEEDDAYKGALVYVEKGNPDREVIYVLVSHAECSFQPYQIER